MSELLEQVRIPTLVMHSRNDAVVPFSEGKLMASRHISNLFDKLGVWTRAQAIVFARDRGFVR